MPVTYHDGLRRPSFLFHRPAAVSGGGSGDAGLAFSREGRRQMTLVSISVFYDGSVLKCCMAFYPARSEHSIPFLINLGSLILPESDCLHVMRSKSLDHFFELRTGD